MRRGAGGLILKIGIFLFVFFAGYYFLFLGPSLALPKAYLETQEVFAEHHANLLQNRMALVGLTRLDVSSANFGNERTSLLATLQRTNEKELLAVENIDKLPRITGVSNEVIAFLNNDIHNVFLPLLEETREILNDQQAIIKQLTDFDIKISDILSYNPSQNLGGLDPVSDKEKIIERATAAAKGIGNIAEKMGSDPATEALRENIKKTQNTLYAFIANTGGGNAQRAYSLQQKAITQLQNLKEGAFALEIAIIQSDKSVTLLTRETNLILKYEFWLKKISAKQAQLAI